MKKLGIVLAIGLLTLSTLGCGLCGLFGSRPDILNVPSPTVPGREVPTPRTGVLVATPTPLSPEFYAELASDEELLINLYKRVNPAVVNIRVVKLVESPEIPDWPEGEDFYQQGQGSGFVLNTDGYIVTNNHVISGAEEVDVVFHDGTIVSASIIGTDPDSDLAVLQVDVSPDWLTSVELGNSDELQVGQRAVAIGNPFGLNGTLTVGIISGLGRTLPLGHISEQVGGRFSIPEVIQTDAAINPGNSGGPLLDSYGAVIGINTAINSEGGTNSGVGFAVPVNTIKRVIPRLISEGYYPYPWLGITGRDLSQIDVDAMDLPVDRGALVVAVTPDGPADLAGIRAGDEEYETKYGKLLVGGDVITAIDDSPVQDFDDLLEYLLSETRPGQRVLLTIIREGEELSVPVVLQERPRD
ncbi:MAG: trypsin-like peptidase domain-containing protein [Chloroflexota bacterium]